MARTFQSIQCLSAAIFKVHHREKNRKRCLDGKHKKYIASVKSNVVRVAYVVCALLISFEKKKK